MEKKERNKKMKTLIVSAVLLVAVIAVAGVIIAKVSGTRTVPVSTDNTALSELYFTRASSTYPPYYQRYKIHLKDGRYMLYHEKREGERFPLTEEDITVSGDIELSEKELSALFACLEGGKAKKPADTAESGGDGPWVYIYYEKDPKKQLEFSFASPEKEAEFEKLCAACCSQN